MSFFGMGPWEMGIIFIVALLIFGPGKLPELAGQAGRAVKDFRRMTSELSGEFEKTMADVTDTKGSLGNELKGIANQVNSVTKSVQKDLNKVGGSTTKSTTKPATAKSTAATTAKSTTTAASRTTTTAKATGTATKAAPAATPPAPKVASKSDPLADMFFSDDDVLPASKSVAAASAARATSTRPATRTSAAPAAPAPDAAIDAVARARQRRIAAGYNSHRAP